MTILNRIITPTLLAFILAACGGNAEQAEVAPAEEPVEEVVEVYSGPNAELVAEFEASGANLLGAIEGLTPEQWTFRESDDRWSIAEVTEHIVMGEQGIVGGFVTGLVAGEPNAENAGGYAEMDQNVRGMIRDRSNPIQAADAMQPTGMYATPEEGIAAFMEARAATLEFLTTTDADLRQYTGTITPEIEPMDTYQWLLFAAGHVDRHVAQIEQVKQHEGYPAAM